MKTRQLLTALAFGIVSHQAHRPLSYLEYKFGNITPLQMTRYLIGSVAVIAAYHVMRSEESGYGSEVEDLFQAHAGVGLGVLMGYFIDGFSD